MATQLAILPISENSSASYHLIFYITGNPGMISYYDTFLATLHQLVSESSSKHESEVLHVFGQSLKGFEDNNGPVPATGVPYSLEDQIQSRIKLLEGQRIPAGPRQGEHYDTITLMGHSVGTYIVLEVLQRLRKLASPLNIRGGVLLMPTIVGIAESPSGVIAAPLLTCVPGLPRGLQLLAKTAFWPLSTGVLQWLVGKVLGMPEDAAKTTTRFLRSNMGVWQALHMARDEMKEITVDKWDDEIWGLEKEIAENKTRIPKLYLYFAETDHWVADHSRDSLIAARGRLPGDDSSSKPVMVVDENGISHAFCISHSEMMAEKVVPWIEEILAAWRK
ncbi:hypothetical protein BJ878DRAFT_493576 [Calycina marina]|uniref:Lipid droplet-associated hydrolase n=1 Tax=Calycina marina TaxID=1763456 RepID=A0A9P7Z989_9HELO|nr:hypothetical protein BJ878DRAFT_493576 [Calycina marina]